MNGTLRHAPVRNLAHWSCGQNRLIFRPTSRCVFNLTQPLRYTPVHPQIVKQLVRNLTSKPSRSTSADQTAAQLRQADAEAVRSAEEAPVSNLRTGFSDSPLPSAVEPPAESTIDSRNIDWTRSYHGLSNAPFSHEASQILLQELDPNEVEVKPDGILYLPEIKYRRILNKAFGPGGWGLAPRGETVVTEKSVTREYALVVLGRLVAIARGEQDYFAPEGIPTAAEGCRSNALTRCCKDLGIASELWDPRFIRKFTKDHVKEVWVEHQTTKKRRRYAMRKDDTVAYPFKEVK